MLKELEEIRRNFFEDLKSKTPETLRIEYLGRKGKLTSILKSLKNLPFSQRREVGKNANLLKKEIEKAIIERKKEVAFFEEKFAWESKPAPWPKFKPGTLHPLSFFRRMLIAPFTKLGFQVEDDREVELSEYNFDRLNIPPYHPARDMQDTFYLLDKREKKMGTLLLRTHTSSVQIRAMERRRPPVYLVIPGRVFRNEATDASHSCFLHQLEALVIDRKINLGSLLWILDFFAKEVFGRKTKTRVRPSYFPFVEPGLEVDFSCIICNGKGYMQSLKKRCSVCSGTGWLEIGGAGMVHPNVLKEMRVDSEIYGGFAFGLGIDRMAMLYYGISDIRLFFENDIRLLKQFQD